MLTRPILDYPIMSKILEFRLPSSWIEYKYEAPTQVIGRLQAIHT